MSTDFGVIWVYESEEKRKSLLWFPRDSEWKGVPYLVFTGKEWDVFVISLDYQGPLLLTWISNHIHFKLWDEITYPFLNFNGCTVEV